MAYPYEQGAGGDYPFDQGPGVGYVDYHQEDGGGKSFGGSCIICLFGCLLFPASLCVLGWNEKNTVCQDRMLLIAEDEAQVGECGSAGDVEGKFTFFSCPIDDSGLQTMTPLTTFNTPGLQELVTFNSVAGAQKVEMYQCIEAKETVKKSSNGQTTTTTKADDDAAALDEHDEKHEEEKDESVMRSEGQVTQSRRRTSSKTTTADVYTYKMGWADVYYDSHTFKATPQNVQSAGCPDFLYNGQVNHNPTAPDRGDQHPIELGRQFITATSVLAGGYTLKDETELKRLTADEKVELTPFADKFSLAPGTDNIITAVNKDTVSVHASSPNYLSSCKTDRLGCIRISYNKSDATHISVLGTTGGSGVMEPSPIKSSFGCEATNFIRMYPEEMTKEEMLTRMRAENTVQTWVLRAVGLLAAWLALYCCFNPIASAADVMGDVLSYIPFFGEALESLLEGVVEMFLCMISCGMGLSCGLFVIALVWLGMRPTIGGPLMAGAIVLFIVGYCAASKAERDPRKMRKGKGMQAEQQPLMYGQGGGYGQAHYGEQ